MSCFYHRHVHTLSLALTQGSHGSSYQGIAVFIEVTISVSSLNDLSKLPIAPSSVEFDKVLRIDLVTVEYYKDLRVDHIVHTAVKEVCNAQVLGGWATEVWMTYCVFPY